MELSYYLVVRLNLLGGSGQARLVFRREWTPDLRFYIDSDDLSGIEEPIPYSVTVKEGEAPRSSVDLRHPTAAPNSHAPDIRKSSSSSIFRWLRSPIIGLRG